jgi:hypothetical protein
VPLEDVVDVGVVLLGGQGTHADGIGRDLVADSPMGYPTV